MCKPPCPCWPDGRHAHRRLQRSWRLGNQEARGTRRPGPSVIAHVTCFFSSFVSFRFGLVGLGVFQAASRPRLWICPGFPGVPEVSTQPLSEGGRPPSCGRLHVRSHALQASTVDRPGGVCCSKLGRLGPHGILCMTHQRVTMTDCLQKEYIYIYTNGVFNPLEKYESEGPIIPKSGI